MKYLKVLIFAIGLTFFGCNQNEEVVVIDEEQTENLQEGQIMTDEEQIQNLIRNVLKWADTKNAVNLWTLLADDKDSLCIGLNMKEHKKSLNKLKKTDFFAKEFIENYNQIIQTLDKKIRNNEFGEISLDGLPPFIFASDINPWCSCQEYPYEDPNVWDVEIEIISLNNEKGELKYKCGEKAIADPKWGQDMKDFRYKFSVKREDNKWKISYMEGFDLEEGVKAM
jgi:hypothetical protein